MSNLVWEMLLRLAKAGAALVLGIILFAIVTGPVGATGSPELALMCWIAAAAFVLLVETSPI